MKTVCLGVRVTRDMLQDIDLACRIVGATSHSELLRAALREYLRSILSDRTKSAVHRRQLPQNEGADAD